jgi:serine/threonine protein kinase
MDKQQGSYFVQTLPDTEFFKIGGSDALYMPTDDAAETELIELPRNSAASLANLEIERRVYRRLGNKHPNIIRCLPLENYGIHLERAKYGSLREYFADGGTATLAERLVWCRDLARAVEFLHEHGIRHADIGGRNVLLDAARRVRLCDFAGSSIDGEPAIVWAESGFRHPGDAEMEELTVGAELHAIGSTLYEIMTSIKPHAAAGVEEWVVAAWIRQGRYSDVAGLALGDVISHCWKGTFAPAGEVACAIDGAMDRALSSNPGEGCKLRT